jgi:hypothetical protein
MINRRHPKFWQVHPAWLVLVVLAAMYTGRLMLVPISQAAAVGADEGVLRPQAS